MLCSSPITSFCEDRVLFLLIHLTGVLYHLFNIFSSHQVFFSFLPECRPNSIILVPWLSQYTGGCIFSLVREARVSCLSTYKVLVILLVPLFYRIVCNLVHLCCTLCFKLLNLSRFMVSLVCQRSNLVLPLLFLLRFS